ncbi:MAG: translation elongation factor Ts [Anaerolineaceae bacterium]|nr:translation elongation factor Ts [Anaerolineaceae bacterium]
MAITTEMIKELRQATSAGVLDCRNALEKTNGDIEKAKEILRERGLAKAAKRSEHVAAEGILELYNHGNGRVGVIVEVNSETDFVGRSDAFRTFAHEIALQIAASAPLYILEEDIPEDVLEREIESAKAMAKEEGKPENIIPKIIEGRLKKFKDENVLMHQPYIRDDSKTIHDLLNDNIVSLGENIVIRRFVRWELGEKSKE